jgi:hypothetical protein
MSPTGTITASGSIWVLFDRSGRCSCLKLGDIQKGWWGRVIGKRGGLVVEYLPLSSQYDK